MPSRDIWSPGGGAVLADAIASVLSMLLLRSDDRRPVYFSSPWITDFPVLRNRFREYAALFPRLADEDEILFSDYLVRLASEREVRVLTADNEHSKAFLRNSKLVTRGLTAKLAEGPFHEKGILAPGVYIEGSMNITYRGVFINREKVTVHAAPDAAVLARIAAAYLEFDRHWENLDAA
jgi:hypothetical protein